MPVKVLITRRFKKGYVNEINKVIKEINRPLFSSLPLPMSQVCRYISFAILRDKISQIGSIIKYTKPDFLVELSESCEMDEE